LAGTLYVIMKQATRADIEGVVLQPLGLAEAHGPKQAMDAIADGAGTFVMVPVSNWHELERAEEQPPPRYKAEAVAPATGSLKGLRTERVAGTRGPRQIKGQQELPADDDKPEED
jgi:hypothetical protein